MKKKNIILNFILVFLFIISFNIKSYGQEENNANKYKNAVTFGVSHSLNMTSFIGTMPSYSTGNIYQTIKITSPRYTMDFGMVIDYFLNEKFSVQSEFLISFTGANFTSKKYLYNEVGKIELSEYQTYRLNYFKFPFSLNFYPNKRIYLLGGMYFSTLISADINYDYYSNTDVIDDVNYIDYGTLFGIGFNMPYFKLGFQYSYGLSKVINDENSNLHNSMFQFILRFKFYSDIRRNN